MHKQKINNWFISLRQVPQWLFLVAGVVFLLISVFSLRANNQNMIELREAVFVADEQDGDVETALKDLRLYVYSHMNTDLAPGENAIRPPIQLKYRYERLVEAERAKIQSGGSGDLYTDAQNFCEQTQPGGFSGKNRLECIREYIDANGGSQDVSKILIPDDLYKFDFASPSWSPDLAGWSIVLSVIFFALFFVRLFVGLAIKTKLRD